MSSSSTSTLASILSRPESDSESRPDSPASQGSFSYSPSETSDSSTYSDRSFDYGTKCVYCMTDILHLGITCVAPECKGMRFCDECFSMNAEIGPHKPTHSYKFFHTGRCRPSAPPRKEGTASSASIISTRTAGAVLDTTMEGAVWYEEELVRLLDGLELYGYGNWGEISNYIATKTALEAKEEYINRFINGPIGKVTLEEMNETEGIFPTDHTVIPNPTAELGVKSGVPLGPLSPSLTSKLPPLEASKEETRLLGLMPKRDDYEREWENDAEKLVSNLTLDPDDDELEVGMKLALVDMYATKVRERAKRKKVVRDHQLVAEFFKTHKAQQSSAAAKGPVAGTSTGSGGDSHSGDEVDVKQQLALYRNNVHQVLRPFSQFFSSKKDYDTMLGNLVMERGLRMRLEILYKYRKMGFTTSEQVYEHELLKLEASKSGKTLKKGLEPLTESDNEGPQQGEGEGDDQSENGDDEGEGERATAEEEEDDDDDFELLSIGGESDKAAAAAAGGRVSPDRFQEFVSSRVQSIDNKKGPVSTLAKARLVKKKKPKTKHFSRKKSHSPGVWEMRRKLKLQKERSERRKKGSAEKLEHRLTTTRSGRVAKRANF